MTKYKQIFLAFLFAILSGVAAAQNNTNSPYTRYGYGQLADQGSANSKAMGGVAYALRDRYQVNFANPAAYTAVDSLTFIFDGGISLQNTNFSDGTLKQNAKNSSFDYITMQFRAARWAAISIGLLPYSNVGYNIGRTYENTENSIASYATQYSGEGGMHQFYFGAGFKLFKNLSIGTNISYFWGNITHTMTETFPSSSTNYPFVIQDNVDIKSYKLDFGLQYTQPIGKKNSVTLGVVYSPGHNLNNTATETRQMGSGSSSTTTVTQNEIDAEYGLPTTFGVGLAYVYDNRLTVAADVTYQNWDKVSFEGNKDFFCKRGKVALGAEFIPNPNGRTYLANVKYRVGAYYSKPYYKVNGVRAADEYGVTAGFGLPIPRTRSSLHLSAQYVHVDGKAGGLLDENTLRICIGITFNERWFFKRKVN